MSAGLTTPAAGNYGLGQTLSFTMNYSTAVIINDQRASLFLRLTPPNATNNDGSITVVASLAAGTANVASTTLVFELPVEEGFPNDRELVMVSGGIELPAGTTIVDASDGGVVYSQNPSNVDFADPNPMGA